MGSEGLRTRADPAEESMKPPSDNAAIYIALFVAPFGSLWAPCLYFSRAFSYNLVV